MLTVKTYLEWNNTACYEATDFLRGFETMAEAWNSDKALPEHMLWALCNDRRVTLEELMAVSEQILEAGLCSEKFRQRIPDETSASDRYACTPWLGGPPITNPWSDEDQQQRRDIMRAAFPALFDCTDKEYLTAQQKGSYR